MRIAPRTTKAIKESVVGALASDLADGAKFVAQKLDDVTDPVTEPASHFVNEKLDTIKAKRDLRKSIKEQVAATVPPTERDLRKQLKQQAKDQAKALKEQAKAAETAAKAQAKGVVA